MGFSVSASTAILFISFLMAAATIYGAVDNSYSSVQAAREEWYNLRLSWIHSSIKVSSITVNGDDITVYFVNNGVTLSTRHIDVFKDGKYSSTLSIGDGYILPGETEAIPHTNVPDGVYVFMYVFDNGCELRFKVTKFNGTAIYSNQQWYCPMEVD